MCLYMCTHKLSQTLSLTTIFAGGARFGIGKIALIQKKNKKQKNRHVIYNIQNIPKQHSKMSRYNYNQGGRLP